MPKLQFALASKKSCPFTKGLTTLLADWNIDTMPLEDVSKLKELPDFTWLNLGKVTPESAPKESLSRLGALQAHDGQHRIFISGCATSPEKHLDLVRSLIAYFPRPDCLDIDLKGEPDIEAALAKYSCIIEADALTRPAAQVDLSVMLPDSDLRTTSGNLSAKKIAGLYEVTLTELGRWIGKKKAALSATPDSDTIQTGLDPYAQIARMRQAVAGDTGFRKWLRTRTPLLESESPLHWLTRGKTREVAEFVEDALTGQPS